MTGGDTIVMRDVAVIGAGPAGLYAAYRLASVGLDVALLDAQQRIGENAVCSGVIGEEAFARFGLPMRPVLNGVGCIQAVSPGGRTLLYRSATPLARVVDKGEFNRELADLARSAGVELCLARFVQAIDREKEGVLLRFDAPQRGVGKLRARVAVIASGVNGSLNGALGLVKPREFLRAIQADIPLGKDGASNPTEVYVGRSVAPGGFGWKIPLGHGRVRVGLMCAEEPRPYFRALLDRVAPGLDRGRRRSGRRPSDRCRWEIVLRIG